MDWTVIFQILQMVLQLINKKKTGQISNDLFKARVLRSRVRWSAVAKSEGVSAFDQAVAGELVEFFDCLAIADDDGLDAIMASAQEGARQMLAARGGAA